MACSPPATRCANSGMVRRSHPAARPWPRWGRGRAVGIPARKEYPTPIFLQTQRLALRPFEPTDVENLCALDSDPDVMRWLSGGAPTPRAVIEREILPAFLASSARHAGFGVWAANATASGEFIGWFSLRPLDEAQPEAVSLGYRLRRAVWNQGLATEGARALIRQAFAEPGVQRITATTYQDNLASRRVMEKLGMTLTRTYRLTLAELHTSETFDGAALALWDGDDVEYTLTRAEWERRAG